MHKPESVQENGIHKILRELKIKIDPLILAWKVGQELINKKNTR